jgi:hypothetical protein
MLCLPDNVIWQDLEWQDAPPRRKPPKRKRRRRSQNTSLLLRQCYQGTLTGFEKETT